EVHHLADLLGEHLAQRPAEHGEVLREDEHPAPEDRPVAGDDSVAVRAPLHHPEVRLAVAHVAVELDEGAGVAQLLGALAREQPTLVPPPLDGLLAAGVERLAAQLGEPGELLLGRLVRAAHAEEPKASLRDADLRGRAGSAGSAALTWRSEKAAPTCAARSGGRSTPSTATRSTSASSVSPSSCRCRSSRCRPARSPTASRAGRWPPS